MQRPSTVFCWTDGLLLLSIDYCSRHNYPADLANILLTCDAIDRSYPLSQELEDGLNRLLAARYVTMVNRTFLILNSGKELVELARGTGLPTTNVFLALRDLEQRLKQGKPLTGVPREVALSNEDYENALKEMRRLGIELTRKVDGKQ